MKVLILAGGFGTRLSEYTEIIPKPMVAIGGYPILWHIMEHYARFGHDDFYIALGYKASVIKEYFLNYNALNSDFTISLKTGEVTTSKNHSVNWRVTLVDTGLQTSTGGRIKRLKDYMGDSRFLMTYGDGVSNVNLNNLISQHEQSQNIVTLTAVRPPARFGDIRFSENNVTSFTEKPQLHDGWINGGFFVCDPLVFDYINDDDEMFEREPLQRIVEAGRCGAFRHEGFWHCMDTKRDKDLLESLWMNSAPWID